MNGADFRLAAATVKYNGTPAVRAIDLHVGPGEAVAIVGPSGSGKTTLLRLLNASLRPAAGSVAVDGTPLETLPDRALRRLRARIGFVHQDLSLIPNLRVAQNVALGRVARRGLAGAVAATFFPRRAALREIHALLERVGIPEKLYERCDALSGGERQRVALARALYQQPEALLADEPVSAVDPARARDTVALLRSIGEERGLTLCVSLHNLELARAFFPRLVGLRRGAIIFDRPAAELSDEDFHWLYELDAGGAARDHA